MIVQQGYGDDGRIYFGGIRRQRGSGLGGLFGTMGRYLLRRAAPVVLPHAASAATSIVLDKILQTQSLGDSVKQHGKEALSKIGKTFMGQKGSGRRRRRRRVKLSKAAPKRKRRTLNRIRKRSIRKRRRTRRRSKKTSNVRYLF